MARTYRRSANGRFAGGGGGSSSGKAGSGGRAVGKGGSKAVARPRVSAKRVAAKRGPLNKRQKFTKFVKAHPAEVSAVAAFGIMHGASAVAHIQHSHAKAKLGAAASANIRFAHNKVAAKRGISQSPAKVLKAARRTFRGAYKISSMK